jgi:hypothetical protein
MHCEVLERALSCGIALFVWFDSFGMEYGSAVPVWGRCIADLFSVTVGREVIGILSCLFMQCLARTIWWMVPVVFMISLFSLGS